MTERPKKIECLADGFQHYRYMYELAGKPGGFFSPDELEKAVHKRLDGKLGTSQGYGMIAKACVDLQTLADWVDWTSLT